MTSITYSNMTTEYDGRSILVSLDANATVNGQEVQMSFSPSMFMSHEDIMDDWNEIVDVSNTYVTVDVAFNINGSLMMDASVTNRITIVKVLKEMYAGLLLRLHQLRTPGRDILLHCIAFSDTMEGGDATEQLRKRMYMKCGFSLHLDMVDDMELGHVLYRLV